MSQDGHKKAPDKAGAKSWIRLFCVSCQQADSDGPDVLQLERLLLPDDSGTGQRNLLDATDRVGSRAPVRRRWKRPLRLLVISATAAWCIAAAATGWDQRRL